MGILLYGAARLAIRVEDRTLAHLRVVVTSKLRRNEPFLLSWTNDVDAGSGRESLWVHPATDLVYQLDADAPPRLDTELLDAMMVSSFSGRGIEIVAERVHS